MNTRLVSNTHKILISLLLVGAMVGIFLSSQVAYADTGDIYPSGDGTIGVNWVTTGGSCWEVIDEGDPVNTSDYISHLNNKTDTAFIRMTGISGVSSVSQIDVYVFHNDGTNGRFHAELYDDDELTSRSLAASFPTSSSDAWGSVSFTGLSLTEAQLDTLSILLSNDRVGGAGQTNYVYSMYAVVTYTPAAPPAPTVSSTTPAKGTTDDAALVVTINGADFVDGVGLAAEINFDTTNPIAGTSVSWVNSGQITATFDLSGVSTNLGSAWDVKVTNPDAQSGTGADTFTIYRPDPTVSTITPSSGVSSGPVDITDLAGANFVSGQTSVQLTKGGEIDIDGTSVVVTGTTQIACTFDITGAAAGAWSVVVTVTGAESTATITDGFTVTAAAAPTVSSTTPAKGTTDDAALVVTINGADFVDGVGLAAEINFDTTNPIAGTSVSWVNSGQITATFDLSGVSTNLGSAWDVKVTNPDAQSGTGADTFTIYRPDPTVSTITPSSGVSSGPVDITDLAGANFVSGQTSVQLTKGGEIDIDGTSVVVTGTTQIACTFDITGAAAGAWSVVVTVTGAESTATITDGFTVTAAAAPTVSSTTPAKGTTDDAALVVTINGADFVDGVGLAAEINFDTTNPIAGTSVSWVNSGQITATFDLSGVSTNLGSAWDVKVTNPDAQSGTGADTFTIYRPDPTVSTITPSSGVSSGPVDITDLAGANFVSGQTSVQLTKGGEIDIDGTSVVVTGTTQIACTFDITGAAAGAWSVVVTVTGAESTATITDGFTVTAAAAPTVSSTTPAKGTTDDAALVVTINGADFVDGVGLAAEINFDTTNPIAGTSVSWVNSGQITATFDLSGVSTNLGSAWDVKVTNPDAQSGTGADTFTIYRPDPTVSTITPSSGVSSGPVDITDLAGANFVSGQTSVQLTKGGEIDIDGTSVVVTGTTQIACTFDITGAAAGAWSVVVTVTGAESTATITDGFTVTAAAAPTVSSTTPAKGTTDDAALVVTINGADFVDGVGLAAEINFDTTNPIAGTSVSWVNSGQITATFDLSGVSTNLGSAWDVKVTNPDAQSGTGADTFTIYRPDPTVSTITPSSGVSSGPVDITDLAGANFVSGQTSVQLTKGGEIDIDGTSVVVTGTTQIACTFDITGAAAGAWSVVVTVTGAESTATITDGFTVTAAAAPTVSSTTPAKGTTDDAALVVTINGADFVDGVGLAAEINFDTTNPIAGTSVSWVNSGQITATFDLSGVSTNLGSAWDVKVTNPDAQSGTGADTFTIYRPDPTVSTITPSSGVSSGPVDITDLAGANFVSGQTSVQLTKGGEIDIDGTSVVVTGTTQIACTFDITGAAAGAWSVVVTVTGAESTATITDGFTVTAAAAPTVSSTTPAKGTTDDAALVVTINGADFVDGVGLAAEINFDTTNPIAGTSVSWVNSGQITATFDLSGVSTNLGSAWDVKVTNPDAQSGTGADTFTIYRPDPTVSTITPSSGVSSGPVDITDLAGANFVSGQTSVQLTKGGEIDIDGTSVVVTGTTQIACTFDITGAAAGAWSVVVTVTGAESTATITDGFTVTAAAAPTVSSTTPAKGTTDDAALVVTINGADFVDGVGLAAEINFDTTNPIAGTSVSWVNSGQITATFDLSGVSTNLGSAWDVKVTNPDAQSGTGADTFTIYRPDPTVSTITPSSGVSSGPVDITDLAGANFVSGQTSVQLTKGGEIDIDGTSVVVTGTTQIACTFDITGAAAGAWSVVVTVTGAESTATITDGFTVTAAAAPTVSSTTPAKGTTDDAALVVTINGADFVDGVGLAAEINFDTTNPIAGTSVSWVNSGQITATFDLSGVSTNLGSAWDVKVTNPDAQSGTGADTFTIYRPDPTVSTITPSSGVSSGPVDITDLAGANFVSGQTSVQLTKGGEIDIDGTSVVVTGTTQIACTFDITGAAAGAWSVVVTVTGAESTATITDGFTVTAAAAPTVSSTTPAKGTTDDAALVVTINGADFVDGVGLAAEINFDTTNPIAGTSVSWVNSGQITATFDLSGVSTNLGSAWDVKVTNPDAQSGTGADTFTIYRPDPTVSTITPSSGVSSGPVDITDLAGANFVSGQTSVQLTKGGEIDIDGTSVVVTGTTQIACTFDITGAAAGAWSVVVTVTGAESTATITDGFTVTAAAAPTVSSTTPAKGTTDDAALVVTINGADFVDGVGLAAEINFDTTNPIAGTSVSWVNSGQITATFDLSGVSTNLGSAWDVKVTNPDAQSGTGADTFTIYRPDPTVSTITPSSGVSSGPVDITDLAGANFVSGQTSVQLTKGGEIDIDGTSVVVTGTTQIACTFDITGAAAGAWSVVVTVTGAESTATITDGFTVTAAAAPTVSSTTPAKGTTDDAALVVTINGADFVDGVGLAAEINFDTTNPIAGTSVSWVNSGQITATFDLSGVSTNLGSAWDVKVTNPDAQSGTGADTFTIYRPDPTVSTITPSSGVSSGPVDITDLAGANFVSGQTSVQLTKGGEIDIDGTSVVVTGTTQIACTFDITGAAAGAWSVVVTVTGAESTATITDGFTVTAAAAPTVSSTTPAKGTTDDAALVVTINGADFVDGVGLAAEINFDTTNPIAGTSVSWVNSGQITATFDLSGVSTNLGSAWDVKVTNPDAQSGTGADTFTIYRPDPTVSTITPSSGVSSGPVDITDLAGANFVSGQTSVQLTKGGEIDIDGTSVVVTGTTQIACTFDITGAAAGAWSVVVTVTGAESTATITDGFTVTAAAAPTVSSTTPAKGTTDDAALVVTINGADFVDGVGLAAEINFDTTNPIAGTSVSWVNSGQITATFDLSGVSTNLGSAWDVKVTNPDAQSGTGADTFTIYRPDPTVSTITPSSGVSSGPVDITDLAGANFVSGQTSVQLTKGGEIDIDGTSVVVTGTTQIACTFDITGAAAGAWSVVVTVTGAESTATITDGFTVTAAAAPTVSSTTPAKGTTDDAALVVTINGADFVDGVGLAAEINFDTTNPIAGTSVSWVNSGQITATFDLSGVSTNLGSAWDVKVTNPDAQSGTGADTFTIYRPDPTVSTITPSSGVSSGPVDITDLAGANFVSGQTSVQLTKGGEIDIDGTSVVVTGTTQIACTFDITGAAAGAWSVVVTVTGAESTATITDGFTVTAETTSPSVISLAVDTDPIYEGDLTQVVAVTFDEEMDSGTNPTITFSQGAMWTSTVAGVWSVGDTVWTETFTLADNDESFTGVQTTASGAKDAAGNTQDGYTEEADVFDIDTAAPTVVSVIPASLDDADIGSVTVTITFSKTMDTGVNPSPTITGLTTLYTITGSTWETGDTQWMGTFTLIDDNEAATGTYNVSGFKDAAGNTMLADTARTVAVDTANPTVASITPNDPLITEADVGAGNFTVTVIYTETMDSTGANDPTITFTPTVASTLTFASDNWSVTTYTDDTYTVTYNVADDGVEVADVDMGVDGANDAAGNAQAAGSMADAFSVDTAAPTIAIGAPSATLTTAGPVTYTITYTGADNVTLADINVMLDKTGTADGTVAVTGTGTAARTVTIDSISGDGTLGISIAAGTASDTAGNTSLAAGPSTTFEVDNTAPTVSVGVSPEPAKAGEVTVTLTFNENMNQAVAPTVTFGLLTPYGQNLVTGTWNSATQWTGSGTATADDEGTNTVSVSTAEDVATNPMVADTSNTFVVDTTAPSVTSLSVDTDLIYDGDLTQVVTATFNEEMDTGMNPTITFGDGTWTSTVAGAWSVGDTVWTETFTLTDKNEEFADVQTTVIGAKDAAGNTQTSYTEIANVFDIDTIGPEMNVTGIMSALIADGDTLPDASDGTDFGGVHITTGSVDRTFTINNTGYADLNLTDSSPHVTITGTAAGDFKVKTVPTTPLAAGDTTTFEITFNPTETGMRTATISIANDDTDENPYDFAIQGEGFGTPTYLVVTGTATMTAGDSNQLTVTAYDASGNVATGYVGTKTLTFTGLASAPDTTAPTVEGLAIALVTVNFTAGVSDTDTATLIAYAAETTSVDVSDGPIDSSDDISYDLDLTVSPADADGPDTSISDVSPDPVTKGSGVTITVTAYDQYQNAITSGGATVVIEIAGASSATPLVTDVGDGTYTATYTPATSGTDSITGTINDVSIGRDAEGSSDGTYNLTVLNTAPVAVDDAFTVAEGGTFDSNTGGDTLDILAGASSVLSNDTDAEDDTLTAVLVTAVSNGTLTLNADGSFTYTHNGSETTSDSFTYKANDGTADSNVATVTITITPVSDLPTISDIANQSTNEDTAMTEVSFTIGDTETAASALTVTATSSDQTLVLNGNITLGGTNATRTINITPAADENGTATITVTVDDGTDTANDTFVLTVNAVNDAPEAVDDAVTVAEDSGANVIDVLGNDSFAPDTGETLTITAITQGAHGSVVITGGGANLTYAPDADYVGDDSFTYTVSDGELTDTATVTVTITNVNDAPVAVDDAATVAEDSGANVIDVLGNDSFAPDTGETLTITAITQGAHGSVVITGGGTGLTYAPDADYSGDDSFTYTVSDGELTDTATVTVTVTNVNDDPVAVDDAFTVAEGGTFDSNTGEDTLDILADASSVLSNDTDVEGDTLLATKLTDPMHGTLTLNSNGTVEYTHDGSETTSDSFTYTVSDGNGGTDTATVTVTITEVNDAPTTSGIDDQVNNDSDSVSLDISGSFDDVDTNDMLTFAATALPEGLSIDGIGLISGTITNNASQASPYWVMITATDEQGVSVDADFTWTVNNPAPTAQDDTATTDRNIPVVVDVLANDSDVDGDTLSVDSVTQPANGVVTNNNSDVIYTPNAEFTGMDTFTYTVSDGNAGTDMATVTVEVLVGGGGGEGEGAVITAMITSPENGLVTEESGRIVTYELVGENLSRATFLHNGKETDIAAKSGAIGITLIPGDNILQVRATNDAGTTASSEQVTVIFIPRLEVAITYPPAMAFAGEGLVTVPSVEVRGVVVSYPAVTEVTIILNEDMMIANVSDGYFEYTITTLEEGLNMIRAEVTDTRGDTASSGTVGVIYLPEILVVEVLSPLDGEMTNAEISAVSGTIAHGRAVTTATLYVNGAANEVTLILESDSEDGGYSYSFDEEMTLREGENTFAVEGSDEIGNSGSSGTMLITLDTTPPRVEITTPATGYLTNQERVLVSGTVDDPAVTQVTVEVNGTGQTIAVVEGSFSGEVVLIEGTNTIRALALDPLGNEGVSQTINGTYNSAAPEVGITSPTGGTRTNSTSLVVNYTIAGGATSAQFILNGNSAQIAAESGSRTVSLVEGENTIEVRASNATITASSGIVTVISDTTAPSMSVDISEPWQEVKITAYSDEELSSPPMVTVTGINATEVEMALSGVRQWTGTYEIPADGNYLVEVHGTDKAGNLGSCTSSFTRQSVSAAPGATITIVSEHLTVDIVVGQEVRDQSVSMVHHYEAPRLGVVTEPTIFVSVRTGTALQWAMTSMTIRATYDPAKLQLPEGMNETAMRLYLWTPSKGGYVPVQGAIVDPVTHCITGTVRY